MRLNRIYITGSLLLFAFLSGRAQQPRIDELECRNLKIGYEKTLHMIFPTPVKYLNMGDENIIGEVIQVCPSVIRLKSTVRDFKERPTCRLLRKTAGITPIAYPSTRERRLSTRRAVPCRKRRFFRFLTRN